MALSFHATNQTFPSGPVASPAMNCGAFATLLAVTPPMVPPNAGVTTTAIARNSKEIQILMGLVPPSLKKDGHGESVVTVLPSPFKVRHPRPRDPAKPIRVAAAGGSEKQRQRVRRVSIREA